jgi:hypothetical protein
MRPDRAGSEGQNVMEELPPTFGTTRDGLHRLACYVIAPAARAGTGHIGLRATPGGFGTPTLADGSSVAVRGAELVVGGRAAPITTLRDAAAIAGIELSPNPDVGSDIPSFEPDADLAVDDAAARALGDWYAIGDDALGRISTGDVSAATLWPEHFDLAVVVTLAGVAQANVGFSPGDSASDEPYLYVGPYDRTGLSGDYWNVPFGALRTRGELATPTDADEFIAEGLSRLAARGESS